MSDSKNRKVEGVELWGHWKHRESGIGVYIIPDGENVSAVMSDFKNRNYGWRGPLIAYESLKRSGPNTWSGTVINPFDHKTYEGSGVVLSVDDKNLTIRGCPKVNLGGLICATVTLEKVGMPVSSHDADGKVKKKDRPKPDSSANQSPAPPF